MNSSASELAELHNQLRAGRFKGNVYELLHEFGELGFTDARATVEQYLADSNPRLRYIALNVLTLHWGCLEHVATCKRLAAEDSDREVRRLAVTSLGSLLYGTKDSGSLAFLLNFLRDNELDDIRESAYDAIMGILGRGSLKPSIRRLTWPDEFDTSVIEEARKLAAAQ